MVGRERKASDSAHFQAANWSGDSWTVQPIPGDLKVDLRLNLIMEETNSKDTKLQ